MSVRFPNDECRGLYCYVSCERCGGTQAIGVTIHSDNGDYDADDQQCPECIDSAMEIVREHAKLGEGYILTNTEARNLLKLAINLVLLINKHGT